MQLDHFFKETNDRGFRYLKPVGKKEKLGIPKQQSYRYPYLNWVLSRVYPIAERLLFGLDYGIEVNEMTFESPVETNFSRNGIVRVKHYQGNSDFAVLVLPQRGYGYSGSQVAAIKLATNGINAYEIETPLKGERLPRAMKDACGLSLTTDDIRTIFLQTVSETRGLIDILEDHYSEFGIWGLSLGAVYSSIVYALDERVKSACLLAAGGNLPELIRTSQDEFISSIRSKLHSSDLSDIEPCNYTDLTKAENLLMVNPTNDRRMPATCCEALTSAWGNPKVIKVKGGHSTAWIRNFRKLSPTFLKHFEETLG